MCGSLTLATAVAHDHPECAALFLRLGADVFQRDAEGVSVLALCKSDVMREALRNAASATLQTATLEKRSADLMVCIEHCMLFPLVLPVLALG